MRFVTEIIILNLFWCVPQDIIFEEFYNYIVNAFDISRKQINNRLGYGVKKNINGNLKS